MGFGPGTKLEDFGGGFQGFIRLFGRYLICGKLNIIWAIVGGRFSSDVYKTTQA